MPTLRFAAKVVLPLLMLLPVLASGLLAQVKPPARPKIPPDPYVGGDAGLMAKIGYTAVGNFPFGTGHGTRDIDELLGSEPLVWIETAHFRIGSALPALPLRATGDGGGEWVDRTRKELKRLAKVLPKVKAEAKDLDQWLRAHLIAMRLEDLYAEVQSVLGVKDADFPPAPGDSRSEAASFRGLGPFLGMREKFTVLLLQRGSSHARYTNAHCKREIADPIRHHDIAFGSMYWGGTLETANGLFGSDLALHTHMVFNVAHNLYTCYRSYSHDPPAWLPTGLAHWHSRRISPRFPTYDRKHDEDREQRTSFWEWGKRVPGMMKNDTFEPLEVFLNRHNAGEFGIEQHIQSWALADYLIQSRKDAFAKFVRACKDPLHAGHKWPEPSEVSRQQRDAMKTMMATTPAELDAAWRLAVLGGKPRK
jgi:hypothetical protein